jgi:hypothetical protein
MDTWQSPIPPAASVEIKHERKGREGRELGCAAFPAAQEQDASVVTGRTAAPAPARHPPRASMTLANTSSRVDNPSPRDANGGMPAFTWKKSALRSNRFSGKENQRPRMSARLPPPPVASTPNIPPRSIRRTVVAKPPSPSSSSAKRQHRRAHWLSRNGFLWPRRVWAPLQSDWRPVLLVFFLSYVHSQQGFKRSSRISIVSRRNGRDV